MALVHFDAHCDTGDDYLGSRFHHGAPFRRAVEEGLLDPKRCIQIGIRGGTVLPNLWQFSYDAGMRVITGSYTRQTIERSGTFIGEFGALGSVSIRVR